MKCNIVQGRLLAAERPDAVSADVNQHLAECRSCRALHERLVQLESDIPQLAVPPSTRRAAFVAQFVQQTPIELAAADQPTLPLVKLHRRTTPPKERGQRKLAMALALAACLAFLVFSLVALNSGKPDPASQYVRDFQTKKSGGLAVATTPQEKVETVRGVARKVCDRVSTLALEKDGDSKVMAALAKYYQQLLDQDLQNYVDQLPKNNRRAALTELAAELQQTESEFTNLAATARPDAKRPLQQIAKAALDAGKRVNKILDADA